MEKLTKDHVLWIMNRYENDPQQLIAVLLDIQNASGKNYIEKKWAELTSEILKVPLSKIYDIITFYAMFKTEPVGEFEIEICRNTPCLYLHSENIVKWFEDAAGIKMGETTEDGLISLFYTSCIGACDIGPVAKIGDDVYGNLTEEKVKILIQLCRERNRLELKSLCQE
ncbi:MAG: NAD(P)H-dependent oxidoreductase subunit E [Treponema sp.]|nr:NAD(P)H-dependent oxidoreductase subunit E [Treponema sp.]